MNIEKFIIENNLQEPKTFEDILKLQEILDDNLHNVRERTFYDVKLSLIAAVIKFNEETKDSHKTWKTKEYSREKELEKLTDIYLFFAQLINFLGMSKDIFNSTFKRFEKADKEKNVSRIISHLSIGFFSTSFDELIRISVQYGYTKEDILKTYWTKWKKNMLRIGKEWN